MITCRGCRRPAPLLRRRRKRWSWSNVGPLCPSCKRFRARRQEPWFWTTLIFGTIDTSTYHGMPEPMFQ